MDLSFVLYASCAIGIGYVSYRIRRHFVLRRQWDRLRNAKLAQREQSLREAYAFVGEEAPPPALIEKIRNAPNTNDLREMLCNGVVSAVTVLRVYYKLALEAHQSTNCLTEILIQSAVAEARAADAYLAANKKPMGPLHGLPLSVKENIAIRGICTTMGCVGRTVNAPMDRDAAVVMQLRKAGAIVFVKTNIPQTMLSFECDNPLYGRTLNPVSSRHTCGGSSGGEAALIALQGSPMGIGSDIGGSCRIPATFCGVLGLKPGFGRIPNRDCTPGVAGQEGIPGVVGVLTRSVEDAVTLLQAILAGKPWEDDANCQPMPWREEEYKLYSTKKLRVGYYTHDGFLAASPPFLRAVHTTIEALRKDGHTVLEFRPPNVLEGVEVFYQCMTGDGGETIEKQLADEPKAKVIEDMLKKMRVPQVVKTLAALALQWTGNAGTASLLRHFARISVTQLYQTVARRNMFRQRFLDAFTKAQLDVIIAPGFSIPAVAHDTFSDVSFAVAPTAVYNVLDWTALALPVGSVDPSLDGAMGQARGEPHAFIHKKVAAVYDLSRKVKGLPTGVQVIAPRLMEERVLGASLQIQAALKKK